MNKIVLITGASSGFGEASARKFAQAGARVILAARSIDKLKTLEQELASYASGDQQNAIAVQLDVTDPNQVDQFLSQLPTDFQKIDILVNNAGLALGLEPAWDTDLEQWDTMIATNCQGLMRMTRRILPGMVERNSGHIINISSIAGNWPYPGGNVYGASKAFVSQFSRNLRADLIGKHIRVTNIEPGMSETNFSNVRFNGDDDKADKVYEGTKPMVGEDIADMIFWAASMPEHVNINNIEAMPTCQAWNAWNIARDM